MSSRIVAVCDICGAEQPIKAGLPLNSYEWERELNLEGWWQRTDFTEICPSHPRPIVAGAAS